MVELLARYDVLGAFWLTVQLSVWSAIGALVVGTVVAILRLSPSTALRALGTGFVTLFINTPLTLLMVFSILGMTYIMGVNLAPDSVADNAFRWAVVMLSLYHAAFVCEALRSGVNTIPAGQAEAARSIGLTFGQSLAHVIGPQAFRGAVAPLGSVAIALIKNTTVAAVIGVSEAAKDMSRIIENEGSGIWVFVVFALGFVVLTLPFGVWVTGFSRRVAVRR